MYACMYEDTTCMYECMHVCMKMRYVGMNVCMNVYMHACMQNSVTLSYIQIYFKGRESLPSRCLHFFTELTPINSSDKTGPLVTKSISFLMKK